MAQPIRVQLSRAKGWKMPENTVKVTRPGTHGNPFRVGGWFMRGDHRPTPAFRMTWCECLRSPADPGFSLIESQEQAVEWFRWLVSTWSERHVANVRDALRGRNLACWCPEGTPCHADILLELANPLLSDREPSGGAG